MPRIARNPLLSCLLSVAALSACGGPQGAGPASAPSGASKAQVLSVYIWPDYLAPDTLADFEKKTGIKTQVLVFDTNETLETKLLAGNSGFDVVFPSAPYFERQIAAGVYQDLDKTRLPNLANMDPQLLQRVAHNDAGNRHGVIYLWGTEGIGFNQAMVRKRLGGIAADSWSLVFDPAVASKLADCGINVLDNPAGVIRLVLTFLHRDPNNPTAQDLKDAESALMRARPYVRTIDSFAYTQALANGDICVAVAYNGDAAQARARAVESGNGVDIGFVIPKEGSIIWFDMMAIPKDAPHSANAHAFLNYVMDARVMARISNFTRYANANAAATSGVEASIASDSMIYPTTGERARMFVQQADPVDRARVLTRIWQRFKTGQ
jgi:putrescine transport system substrate-binding protein